MPIALVTGANRGIGREVARQLASRGVHVFLGARTLADSREAADSINATSPDGHAEAVQLDVTDPASVQATRQTVAAHGGLDVLVNNAGTDYDTDQRVLTADLDRVRRVWETNTLGPWRLAQVFAPMLRESPHGRLVNVSSQAGQLGSLGSGTPAYSHSKAALNAVTLMLASALPGVLVNAVCPGWVRTDMGGQAAPRSVEQGAASVVWAATLPDGGPTGGFFRDGDRLAW
ncbi:MAG: SDR family NAD(P)-dependent oxidoreductase [Bacteroidota bacterium]